MEENQNRLLKQALNEPEKHEKAFKLFKETYEGLQIGAYNESVLVDIIDHGTVNIEKVFKAIASDQLDKSGVTSPQLAQVLAHRGLSSGLTCAPFKQIN
jgi:hypothetical protein